MPIAPFSPLASIGSILAASETGFPPERLTMQEEIKLIVESLFGASGLAFVYDRLGLHEHVDQELDMMEDFELVAIHDLVNEMLETGQMETTVK